jgi:hypothetical protein
MKPEKIAPDHINPAYITDDAMGTVLDVRSSSLREVFRDAIDRQRKNPAKARKLGARDPFLDPTDPFFRPFERQANLRETAIPELLDDDGPDPGGYKAEARAVVRQFGVKDENEIDDARPRTVYLRVRGEEVPGIIEHKEGSAWSCVAGGKRFSAATRDDVLMLAVRDLNHDTTNLSDQQLLEISRLAHSGTVPGLENNVLLAIDRFVTARIGVPLHIAYTQPRYLNVVNEAVNFCFLAASPTFSPGNDWLEYLGAYSNGRPHTLALLTGAAQEYLKERQTTARERMIFKDEQPEATQISAADLDGLDDSALQNLYRHVSRDHANMSKRSLVEAAIARARNQS